MFMFMFMSMSMSMSMSMYVCMYVCMYVYKYINIYIYIYIHMVNYSDASGRAGPSDLEDQQARLSPPALAPLLMIYTTIYLSIHLCISVI